MVFTARLQSDSLAGPCVTCLQVHWNSRLVHVLPTFTDLIVTHAQTTKRFMFAPPVYDIIQYTNVTNETRFINKTRWFNKTHNITIYINKTRWTNKTRFINKTRWFNKTYTIERIIWVNKHTNQSHYPTVISEKLENTTHKSGKRFDYMGFLPRDWFYGRMFL
jgi:hypothetical protein